MCELYAFSRACASLPQTPQLVYMVRHGESEFNAATSRRGSAFSDPQIFDAPLSARGRIQVVVVLGNSMFDHTCHISIPSGNTNTQATSLRPQLRALNLPSDALWVSSPLTRALETFWLGCPIIARGGPDCPARDTPPGNLAVCR